MTSLFHSILTSHFNILFTPNQEKSIKLVRYDVYLTALFDFSWSALISLEISTMKLKNWTLVHFWQEFFHNFTYINQITLPFRFSSHITHIETLLIMGRGFEGWDHHFVVGEEGGQILKRHELLSQDTSKAQISHNSFIYDQVTSCLNGFLVRSDTFKVMSFQTTFFTSRGITWDRERETWTDFQYHND